MGTDRTALLKVEVSHTSPKLDAGECPSARNTEIRVAHLVSQRARGGKGPSSLDQLILGRRTSSVERVQQTGESTDSFDANSAIVSV